MGVVAWTRQDAAVMDELERTGHYQVREEYVRIKNGSISDYYLGLYHWLTQGCRSRVAMPPDATLPIWLALTEAQKLGAAPGCVTLELEVPEESLFVLDYDLWGYRVNNWYIPRDPADERAHNDELARMGIANEALLVMGEQGNYYPQLRTKLTRSWERVFEGPNEDMDHNVGVIWEIRPEWVRDVVRYE